MVDDNQPDDLDAAEQDLHEAIEGVHQYDSTAEAIEDDVAFTPDEDERRAAGLPPRTGGARDERTGEPGQDEGFEESEAMLIRAAEGQYDPPSAASRDGESDETLRSPAEYGEADDARSHAD